MSKLIKHYSIIANKKLLSLQVNLLNKCTSRCSYCRKYEWPDEKLSLEKLKHTLKYLRDEGLQTVVFSGGDPILYEDLEDLLKYCKSINLKTSAITTLLTHNYDILCTVSKYLDRLTVSLDATNATDYKKLRGVNGYDLAITNIKMVNALREENGLEPIRLSSTISISNVDDMQGLFEIAKDTKSHINFYCVHTHQQYVLKDYNKFYDNVKLISDLDIDNISNCKTITNNTCKINSTYCNLCKIHAVIDANGDVYPCCHLLDDNGPYLQQNKYSYGNINYEDIEQVFERRKTLKYDVINDCGGCVGRYQHLIDEVNEIIESGSTELWL